MIPRCSLSYISLTVLLVIDNFFVHQRNFDTLVREIIDPRDFDTLLSKMIEALNHGEKYVKSMSTLHELFHDGGCYHIETSPLIYSANHWTGFYVITASVMKELTVFTRE